MQKIILLIIFFTFQISLLKSDENYYLMLKNNKVNGLLDSCFLSPRSNLSPNLSFYAGLTLLGLCVTKIFFCEKAGWMQ